MTQKIRAILAGLLILMLVGGGIGAMRSESFRALILSSRPAEITLTGYVGGEKMDFIESIRPILLQRYGITLQETKRGSIRMVTDTPPAGMDFLWPSTDVASEIYRDRFGAPVAEELIFSSPLVILSWQPVVDALIAKGMVAQRDGTYYVIDMTRMVEAIKTGTRWADLGLPELNGRMMILSTDPTESNSGNMFASLVATLINKGDVPVTTDLPTIGPDVQQFFGRMGHMSRSSSDIFKQFLSAGIGAYPMIVVYENQLVEHYFANERDRALIKSQVKALYPQPTVWSQHPLIALTADGKRLIEALKDPEIQQIAWEQHGFRSGVAGVTNDPGAIELAGLPRQILNVVALPRADVVEHLITDWLPKQQSRP